MVAKEIVDARIKTDHGMAEKKFTVYRTHHGPVIREEDGKVGEHPPDAVAHQGADAILPAHQGQDYKDYRQTMELKANSSNNTIFADADGDIAYFHGNFIPRRDTSFRLDQAGGWQQSRDRVERASCRSTKRRTC